MGIETLLLPGGVAIAVILLWIAIYKGIFSRSAPTTTLVQPSVEAQPIVAAPVPERIAEPVQESPAPTQSIVTPAVVTASIAEELTPIAEAPLPFEEPQTAFTNPSVSSTAMPTDTTAVSNIASPVENLAPVLVIARPKRVRRATKRLPANGAPRRKRSTPVKPSTAGTETPAISGQQNEVNQ
jgi:hypothetical protein